MDKALSLLQLQKNALQASTLQEAAFAFVNKTHMLVPYDQAIFFTQSPSGLKAHSISGNASIDPNGQHTKFFNRIFGGVLSNIQGEESHCISLDHSAFTGEDATEWKELSRAHNMLIALRTPDDGLLGCLLLQRAKNFTVPEKTVLEELAFTYARALVIQRYRANQTSGLFGIFKSRFSGRRTGYIALGFIILALLPVRLSINAPAEIITTQSNLITAPFAGTIQNIAVKPGQAVTKDTLLASMEKDEIRAQQQSAKDALELAKLALSRARRESLSDPDKKAEISRLQGEINQRQIEYDYADTLLQRTEILSPQQGVALFADANTLQGKPVNTGDPIMQIADPSQYELLIRVPVDALIQLNEDASVKFHPSASPLSSHKGRIISTTYQSSADADGLMTYKLRAQLDDQDDLKIGWKGSAKIYGQWSILGYSILRRPLISLRTITGI